MNKNIVVISNIKRHYIDPDTGKAVVKKLSEKEATEWIETQLINTEDTKDATTDD